MDGGSAGQRGVCNVRIDGLTIDMQGKTYIETVVTWQPSGLMSVRPSGFMLNLTIKRAHFGSLALGSNAAQGSVEIATADAGEDERVAVPEVRPSEWTR